MPDVPRHEGGRRPTTRQLADRPGHRLCETREGLEGGGSKGSRKQPYMKARTSLYFTSSKVTVRVTPETSTDDTESAEDDEGTGVTGNEAPESATGDADNEARTTGGGGGGKRIAATSSPDNPEPPDAA